MRPITSFDLKKFLRRHPTEPLANWQYCPFCAVIPAWDELADLPEVLQSLDQARHSFSQKVAIIVVVNHPIGQSAEKSLELLDCLKQTSLPDLYPIYAPELHCGAGEARAIGMNAFIASLNADEINNSVICSVDADSPVEKEYFSTIQQQLNSHPEAVGFTVNFRHQTAETSQQEAAIRFYEDWQERYCATLKRAGSPYAFKTVGSAMGCWAGAYLRCGGMKLKKAGEDFYFLQDLKKTGEIIEIQKVLVHPSSRISNRVPFGTGPALRDILLGKYPFEVPENGEAELKKLLETSGDIELLAEPDKLLSQFSNSAREFLIREKFPDNWRKILANRKKNELINAFNEWFDGLKTLRFLHYLAGNASKQREANGAK